MPLQAKDIHPSMRQAFNPAWPNGTATAGRQTMIFRLRRAINDEPGPIIHEHRLLCMPSTYSEETEGRSRLYYTKSKVAVDTPFPSAIGVTYFTITGTTLFRGIPQALLPKGNEPVTASVLLDTLRTFGGSLGGVTPRGSLIDGAAAIQDLQATIRQYMFPDGAAPQTTGTHPSDYHLEFINIGTPQSQKDPAGLAGWRIHPHRNLVSVRQDAQHPFLWHYSFQFAGINLLKDQKPKDGLVVDFNAPQTLKSTVLDRLKAVVQDTTRGLNTVALSLDTFVIQNVTGPVSTLLLGTNQLAKAVQGLLGGISQKIAFPLYAQSVLQESLLTLTSHSVSTLASTAQLFSGLLTDSARGQSLSTPQAGTALTAGTNDHLTLSLNDEAPFTLTLGTQTTGAAIAAAIQAGVRATTPQSPANAAAYRNFTAAYTNGQYRLLTGTYLADASSVVVSTPDTELEPLDASVVLALGSAQGGQEQHGSAVPCRALALLRGLVSACQRLQAFPELFADSLQHHTATLATSQTTPVPGQRVTGEQQVTQTLITPDDTLQALANRVGVPWETLALTNHLAYPYILHEPSTRLLGRVTTATDYTLTDSTQARTVNGDAAAGSRIDLLAGKGAGQSRLILANTSTAWTVDDAWLIVPDSTTDFAIRAAHNPIIRNGSVTNATAFSLTDTSMALVAGSQDGFLLRIAGGPGAGQQRPIAEHTSTTYLFTRAWEEQPTSASTYVVLSPTQGDRPYLLVGEALAVPRTAITMRLRSVRMGLEDISPFTGEVAPPEIKLFGRDLLLVDGGLQWDPVARDVATIAGLPNLRQAVINLINLPLGELEHHPTVGSYVKEALGAWATLPLQVELIHSVERTILQDTRIAAMQDVRLSGVAGTVGLSFTAVAVNGATVSRIAIQ